MAEAKGYERPEGFAKTVYDQWKEGRDATKDQLDREIEDLEWQVAEKQWDDTARAQRGRSTEDGIDIPARPMLSIPKIKMPMALVDNQFRAADLRVNVHPVSEDADEDTAEVIQDIYRQIDRDPGAKQARWWAFDRAKQAGRGFYRVNSVYDESTDDPFDQKIVIERIKYQSSVVMDPSAVRADLSDAQYGFITSWVTKSAFRRRWPDAKLSEAMEDAEKAGMQKLDLEAMTADTPNWVEDGKGIQVAEYWHKHYTTEKKTSKDGKRTRPYEKCEIRWTIFGPGGDDGLDVLEEQEWNGDQIPIIPAFWSELQPFDDETRYEGMVRPARDGGKLYNFMASEAVSAVGNLPKAPWVGDIRSFEPYLNAWKQSNTRAFPFLPIATVFENGQMIAPPQRTQSDSSILQPLMIMLQQADDFIQSSTATPDPVLGKANTRNQSGKAIQALQGQSEASNSSGIQNFADVTMMQEARVVVGMMKRLLDRKGRMTHAMNAEGKVRPVILNAPFTMDQNGRPRRVAPQPPGQTTTQQPQNVKTYDLTKGFYDFSVTIGKGYNTNREQAADLLSSVMEKDPELGVVLAPLLLTKMDGPGMAEAAELAKEYRSMKYPGIGQPKDGTMTPEMLQQKVKSQEMQIQQMQQAGTELQKQLETNQAKQQADMQKAQIQAEIDQAKIAAELRKAEMDNSARIEVANIQAKSRMSQTEVEAMISIALDRSKQAQAEFDRNHAKDLRHTELAHDVAISLGGQEHAQELQEGAQDHAAQQAEAQRQAEAESAQEDAGEAGEE